jgi:Family of unknown function (DUF6504)
MEFSPLHFYDQPIEPIFDTPPVREKAPDCPNGFIWEDKTYRVTEMLSSWNDFKRRGRMARNMQPAHAAVASMRGSLNVGRYYFRVRVEVAKSSSSTAGRTEGGTAGRTEGGTAGRTEGGTAGRTEGETAGRTEGGTAGRKEGGTAGRMEEQIFDIYYDRAMKNVDDRKGQWFVYRELRSAA